ncbi:FtsK/SpoIIIE domain-containing protein [Nonomuraea sp. NPDC046802]|uniref:FtsK/SpoIIIE domain-containing protein n=1 Tax=Nonomuraea sp. NPDC046802 TaxID=3154919 RepID=UPI0033EF0E18
MPRLIRVTCDGWADRITVRMLGGQAVKDWSDRIDNLTQGFGATSCRVAVIKGGRLLLTIPRSDPLAAPMPALPIPDEPSVGPVEIGKQEDGRPLRLKVHGTHVLIAGATGAGKGSFLWDTIRGLLCAMRAGLVQIWALDPKLMELSFGRELFEGRYAADPADCADLLDEAVSVMQKRATRFAGLQRSHVPTIEDPFVLVLVDEVAFLTAYQPDRQLRQRISAALATLATQGRSVGVGVMAALQDPRKEVMNIRNLFPDKGDAHEQRGLKHRGRDDVRPVPIPPKLVQILRQHIEEFGVAEDGRLFRSERGKVVASTAYTEVWQDARALALTPAQVASPLAHRPYDLRHAGVSLWLNAGVPAPDVAERAGHGVDVLLRVYAKCLDGQQEIANKRIEDALAA